VAAVPVEVTVSLDQLEQQIQVVVAVEAEVPLAAMLERVAVVADTSMRFSSLQQLLTATPLESAALLDQAVVMRAVPEDQASS
jgi:hypothetical protein